MIRNLRRSATAAREAKDDAFVFTGTVLQGAAWEGGKLVVTEELSFDMPPVGIRSRVGRIAWTTMLPHASRSIATPTWKPGDFPGGRSRKGMCIRRTSRSRITSYQCPST